MAAPTALITGCSTGFGLETALQLAERGYVVYATMRDLSRRAALDAGAKSRGIDLRVMSLDITDPTSIDTAVGTIVDESGRIDVLVNNAGSFVRGFFEELLDGEIRSLFETNLYGTMAVTRAVLPYMRRARQGHIVIITSVTARIGAPTSTAYSACRFAQEGFAESLSQEVAPLGIKVILVESGMSKGESWPPGRGASARSNDLTSPYYPWFRRSGLLFDRAMQTSPITSRDVAGTVCRAVSAHRPRLRYVVGSRARAVIALRRYSPGETFERLYFGEVVRRMTRGLPAPNE